MGRPVRGVYHWALGTWGMSSCAIKAKTRTIRRNFGLPPAKSRTLPADAVATMPLHGISFRGEPPPPIKASTTLERKSSTVHESNSE